MAFHAVAPNVVRVTSTVQLLMSVSNWAWAPAIPALSNWAAPSTKRGYSWAPAAGSVESRTSPAGSSSASGVEGTVANAGSGPIVFVGWPVLVLMLRLAAVVTYCAPHGGSTIDWGLVPC